MPKVICQSSTVMGGMAPIIGRQSTIDNPEPVNRVTPPRITMKKTMTQQVRSHFATAKFSVEILFSISIKDFHVLFINSFYLYFMMKLF
jgi:hypothetical protein